MTADLPARGRQPTDSGVCPLSSAGRPGVTCSRVSRHRSQLPPHPLYRRENQGPEDRSHWPQAQDSGDDARAPPVCPDLGRQRGPPGLGTWRPPVPPRPWGQVPLFVISRAFSGTAAWSLWPGEGLLGSSEPRPLRLVTQAPVQPPPPTSHQCGRPFLPQGPCTRLDQAAVPPREGALPQASLCKPRPSRHVPCVPTTPTLPDGLGPDASSRPPEIRARRSGPRLWLTRPLQGPRSAPSAPLFTQRMFIGCQRGARPCQARPPFLASSW